MKLIIFDLDQTLIDLITVHKETYKETFKKFFNVKATLTEIDFAGKSLTETFFELARLKNIPENKVKKNIKKMIKFYEKGFTKNFPKNPSRYILPGAKKLLEKLSERENIIALYTGCSENITKKVLTESSLKKYFKFSLYGTEVKSRKEMIELAIKKAEKLTGRKFKNKDIVVIGDSIRDIDCGKQFNALTIAVATGFHSEEQLLKHKPDYLFKNMKDYKRILKVI